MIGSTPLAPEHRRSVGEWFEKHFADYFSQLLDYRHEPHSTSGQPSGSVNQAKTHLLYMLTMDGHKRVTYLKGNGCSDREVAFVKRLQSSWLDNSVRNKVTAVAKDCVIREEEFGCLLDHWLGQDETQRLRKMLISRAIHPHHLAVSYAICQATEMAFGVYIGEKEAVGESAPMSTKPPTPAGAALPEILHEASRTIARQLEDYASTADYHNDPDVQPPRPEDVAWVGGKLEEHWLTEMPIPFIFPTEYGGLNIEWYVGHAEHSLEVDFANHTGVWAWWDSESDRVHEETLNLKQATDWHKLQKSSTGRRHTR